MSGITAWLGLDSSKFDAGLKGANRSTQSFAASFKSVTAGLGVSLGVAAFAGYAKTVFNFTADLADLSDSLGISTDALQGLAAAGESFGISQEQMTTLISKVIAKQTDAADASSSYAKALHLAGINSLAFANASPEEAIQMIANAAKAGATNSNAMAAVFDTIGTKAGPRLLGVLNQIADEGLQNIIDRTDKVAAATIDAADRMDNAWNAFMRKTKVKAAQWAFDMKDALTAIDPSVLDINLPDPTAPVIPVQPKPVTQFDTTRRTSRANEYDPSIEDGIQARIKEQERLYDEGKQEWLGLNMDLAEARKSKNESAFGVTGSFGAASSFESLGAQIGKSSPMAGQLNKMDRMIQVNERQASSTALIATILAEMASKGNTPSNYTGPVN